MIAIDDVNSVCAHVYNLCVSGFAPLPLMTLGVCVCDLCVTGFVL